jgi:ATP/maltotriose-dependent transcriptional regulator MalT
MIAGAMRHTSVVGRRAELDAIHAFVAGIGVQLRGLTLFGEPGIGKTTLWEAGVEHATALGHHVLAHRCVETEAGLAFAALGDLVTPHLAAIAGLSAPRRQALEVALLLEEPGASPPDARAIGLALLDLVRVLSEDRPVVVAIDDLQWLDSSSAVVLALALRRLRDERVAVLTTLRSAPGVRAPFALEDVLGAPAVSERALAPLELSELHRLIADRLSLELSRPELARILDASAGNPFFALELARWGRAGPAPGSLRDALGERLAGLPAQDRETLAAVSALARPDPDLVIAVADDAQQARACLRHRARDGTLRVDGERLRFTHPLLASLSYEQLPPDRRRLLHRRLAGVLGDVEQRARHHALAAEGPDAGLAAELDAAAQHAASRGATAAAAELAELALERTPPGDEDARRARRLAAARFHHFAGDFPRAMELYRGVAAELPPGPERGRVLYTLALIGLDDLPTRTALCDRALHDAGDDDALAAQVLGFQAISRWVQGELRAGLAAAREGLARAERLGDLHVIAVAIGRVGLLETWALDVTPGLLERGVAIEQELADPLFFQDSPAFMLTQRLYETDRLDESRELLQAMERDAAARGDEHTHQWVVLQLLMVEWYAGRLEQALAHARAARDVAEMTHEAQFGGMVACTAARVEATLGLLDDAQRTAERGMELSRSVSDAVFANANRSALGYVHLVRGDLRAAAEHLREVPANQIRTGHLSPIGGSWTDCIEALIGIGDLERAETYLRQFEEIAARSNRAARAGAARCSGLLSAARGDTATAIAELERALRADDPPMYPLEHARTLLALGAVRRHALQRRAARETLEQALAAFQALGAAPWARRTRDELTRISGRRATREELTEAERRVAALAAHGLRNREIAAELYLSVGTVEAHLSRVYRKLGLRSRAELAGRFARPADDAAKL